MSKIDETAWHTLSYDVVLHRAIEVAAAGRHTLRVFGNRYATGAEALTELKPFGVAWTWETICPCGGLGTRSQECACSLRLLQRLARRQVAKHFDINLELGQPAESALRQRDARRYEPLGKVVERIARAQALPMPVGLDDAGKALLSRAQDVLFLSVAERDSALAVAATIARLSVSPGPIRPAHLAEALQYRLPERIRHLARAVQS